MLKHLKWSYLEKTDMENTDKEKADMENADMENADMENADMGNADVKNADLKNTDKHMKKSCMIDGLPCNRFANIAYTLILNDKIRNFEQFELHDHVI